MTTKTKSIIRKIIYAILFAAMIGCFIYLGEKYADNSEEKIETIRDYYDNEELKNFEVIYGSKMISLLKEGNHLIFIGNKKSEFSIKYIEELNNAIKELEVDKIYYYDIINDKAQKNSNYYKIVELLNGSLITTDSSNNNLLAPSFYIVDNGEVKYYNIETSAMKNNATTKEYWTIDKEINFKLEIQNAINKYYLNK